MKAKFSCLLSAFALVLFVAAPIPSQATQRRDPLVPQEVAQADAPTSTTVKTRAHNKGSMRSATAGAKKHAKSSSPSSAKNIGTPRTHSDSGGK